MSRFLVVFKMVNHYDDDAGCIQPQERTIVESPCNMTAVQQFCNDMSGENFEIISVEEVV
jgi:hypothetical protein